MACLSSVHKVYGFMLMTGTFMCTRECVHMHREHVRSLFVHPSLDPRDIRYKNSSEVKCKKDIRGEKLYSNKNGQGESDQSINWNTPLKISCQFTYYT